MLKGYGGWIKIKNVPLEFWCGSTFEAIEDHFGGLIDRATETLNLTNCSEALIQVKKNLCRFVPSTIEILNLKRGNIFLHFGDFEFLPNHSKAPNLQDDFSNFIDQLRIREVLHDEGFDLSSFPPVLNVP